MSQTLYQIAADVVVLLHLSFVIYVVTGGLAGYWRLMFLWLHLPALLWGVLAEINGWVCPLTPLENYLRLRGGAEGYSGGFIENLILPVLYPAGLTRTVQLVLGIVALLVNLIVYGIVIRHHLLKKGRRSFRGRD